MKQKLKRTDAFTEAVLFLSLRIIFHLLIEFNNLRKLLKSTDLIMDEFVVSYFHFPTPVFPRSLIRFIFIFLYNKVRSCKSWEEPFQNYFQCVIYLFVG